MGPAQFEKRLAAMEAELARLKTKIEGLNAIKPWWERIAGTFQDDPAYEKAMKLGRQFRRSFRSKPRRPKRGR